MADGLCLMRSGGGIRKDGRVPGHGGRCQGRGQAKSGASLARTSLMIDAGTASSRRPLRARRSGVRGWSQRMTPVVAVPAPTSDTAKPAPRAKLPPLVMGTTTGALVNRLKAVGETTRTGRVPRCSCPAVGSRQTSQMSR